MDFDEAMRENEAARSKMNELTESHKASILGRLETYLHNRAEIYETHNRIDPDSPATRAALAALEKAREEVNELRQRYGTHADDDRAVARDKPADGVQKGDEAR